MTLMPDRLAADPSAALRFFGTVEIRSGWGDPWPALFKNRCDPDGLQIATIVERAWLPFNRKEGREALPPAKQKIAFRVFQKSLRSISPQELVAMRETIEQRGSTALAEALDSARR